MKKICYLLFLLPAFASAQQWFQSDYRWVFSLSGGFAGFDEQIEMQADIDTVIHGRNCRKWVFNSTGYFKLQPHFTIGDGPRAYVYSERVDSFALMYDFSLPVGTIVSMPDHFDVFSYRIDSVDLVQAGDFLLKRQRVTRYFNGDPTMWQFDILENIGMVGQPFDYPYPTCSFALAPEIECGSIADGIDYKFMCFSNATGSFHPFADNCALLSTVDCDAPVVEVLPNPVIDQLQIYVKNSHCQLQEIWLYDAQGRQVLHRADGQLKISLPPMPSGMYLLDMRFNNGARVVKKLIRK